MDQNNSGSDPRPPAEGALPEGAIAVVGMAAHLPGAPDIERYWENLRSGTESITRFTDEELEAAGVDPALLRNPHYVKANGVLERMEWFDAGFFGLSPKDAAVMDPQTRHFLECVWHALEHAGHVPERFDGSIGVFAGAGAPTYFWRNVMRDPELVRTVGYFLLRHTGNDKDFVATRASYEFDLTGPSVSVQTACSTSLVGIHMACQSLLSWECDMALAGGVTIEQPHHTGYLYEEGEILSPDGHCRSFDHRAQGTVFGSGAGIVVLRRLEDAVEAGDTIHAVIRGSAVNNDGAGKVSYLAPSVDGQAKAIAEALSLSGVDAESIGMVEAHGTATPVGDPIEVTALTQAFRTQTERTGFCALGSVKSNIGHLDTAAGVASFIKATLAVKHGEIPPTVHFEKPNPLLQLDQSPFYVPAATRPWPSTGSVRRAGVSSLGVGGTNAHVILEEAPPARPSGPARDRHLLVLSARSKEALEDASRALVERLDTDTDLDLADVSYTLRTGRRRFEHRRALVCATAEDAVQALATHEGLVDTESSAERREVAFLFAGGGAQYPNMGRELYEREPVFRRELDRCLDHIEATEGLDVRGLLFCEPGDEEAAATKLQRPSMALPALFAVQYAQAQLWTSWGVAPTAMLGHSMGEYTAACLSGVFSPEVGMTLVALRGRLFEKVDRGAMLSVSLPEAEITAYLGDRLSLAALNAPEVSVAAGPEDAIEALEARLTADGHDCRRIRIDVAAHSSMLEPVLEEFGAFLRTVDFSAPTIPVISNLTGEPATEAELTDPDYWVRHLRHTVRFADGVGRLLRPDGPVLLEVGPGRTLATLSRMHPAWSKDQPAMHSLPHPDERTDAQEFQLRTLGALWAHGVDADWAAFDGEGFRRRVPLPGYPFQRQPYFVAPPAAGDDAAVASGGVDAGERRADPADWFHQTAWTPTPRPERAATEEGVALLLEGAGSPGDAIANDLADELTRSGWRVVRARPAAAFATGETGSDYAVRPEARDDWVALFGALREASSLPGLFVHAGSLRALGDERAGGPDAFFSSLFAIQALEEIAPGHPLRFVALATGAAGLPGDTALDPWAALLQGPVRVAPRELPALRARLVDAGPVPADARGRRRLAARLVTEASTAGDDTIVAYRDGERLVETFRPVPVGEGTPAAGIVEGGTYLVTGGLGGLGLVVARELVEQARVNLVLIGRSGLPEVAERDAWLRDHPEDDKTSRAIREVRSLEAAGAGVLVRAADVTDAAALRRVVEEARGRFGRIDGVIHTAGTLDDGPLLVRTREQAEAVLAAKTRGTLALETALQGEDLDLVLLFSSVSAVIGAPGQIDYAAANAFMDVFARARLDRIADRVVSVGWGAWRDVGMAAELAGEARYGATASAGSDTAIDDAHFDVEIRSGDTVALRGRWSRARHWMIDEHRVRDGDWVLPGSGYVELLRHAWHRVEPGLPFVLRDLVFMRPFGVREGEERDLEFHLERSGEGEYLATVRSRASEERDWTDHASATLGGAWTGNGSTALAEVTARLGTPSPIEQPEHPFMAFGPRWMNIAARASGEGEALLRHELPASFAGDLDDALLHPALLDMATAGAQDLVEGIDPVSDFLVPAGYGAVRAPGRFGATVLSHIRLTGADEGGTFASFDVTTWDESGTLLAEIRGFDMIRLQGDELAGDHADGEPAWLAAAISPDEGLDVLRRVLSHDTGPHVLVATRSLPALIEEAGRATVRARPATPARKAPERVPLPEVARTLEAHEAVAEAAVIGGVEGASGDAGRIVAFVVYEPGRQATVSELRRFVRKQLDRASAPQNFVEMVALPRDAAGEVDFAELRDPFAVEDDFVAPRTDAEKAVAGIWAELLGLDRVGIHDNFLDVGGHSLVGIRVLVKIKQETGIRLEANDLTLQTLEQLAAQIDRRSGNGGAPPEDASA
jgi:acyl transferase domain-containing protein